MELGRGYGAGQRVWCTRENMRETSVHHEVYMIELSVEKEK